MSSTEDEADVVIVGGGPCGLALAIGMRQLGYSRVVVVERCAEAVDDWSKAYSAPNLTLTLTQARTRTRARTRTSR